MLLPRSWVTLTSALTSAPERAWELATFPPSGLPGRHLTSWGAAQQSNHDNQVRQPTGMRLIDAAKQRHFPRPHAIEHVLTAASSGRRATIRAVRDLALVSSAGRPAPGSRPSIIIGGRQGVDNTGYRKQTAHLPRLRSCLACFSAAMRAFETADLVGETAIGQLAQPLGFQVQLPVTPSASDH